MKFKSKKDEKRAKSFIENAKLSKSQADKELAVLYGLITSTKAEERVMIDARDGLVTVSGGTAEKPYQKEVYNTEETIREITLGLHYVICPRAEKTE